MTHLAGRWDFKGGYSKLLSESRVEFELIADPFKGQIDLSPAGLMRRDRPLHLTFRVVRPLSGRGPEGIRWRILPDAEVVATILFSGNAYLGNFKVPPGHMAVQWTINAHTGAGLKRRVRHLVLGVDADTRLTHSWVSVLSGEQIALPGLLKSSWSAYVNPFDPEAVKDLSSGCVTRWRWKGEAALSAEIVWELAGGWSLGLPAASSLGFSVRSGAKASIEKVWKGTLTLQVVRMRDGVLRITLDREAGRTVKGSVNVRASLGKSVRLEPAEIVSPFIKDLNSKLPQALAKRFEIEAALDAEKWKTQRRLLRVSWSDTGPGEFVESYARILAGGLPDRAAGIKFEGRFERVRGRKLELRVNFLNWVRLGFRKLSERRTVVTVGPAGELIVEEGVLLESIRHRWDQLQFIRLLEHRVQDEGDLHWSYEREGTFRYQELVSFLKAGLHSRSLAGFELPGSRSFPLQIRLLWVTRFSAEGLRAVRDTSTQAFWAAAVRALELAEPGHYGRPGYRRDWIEVPAVRELIDRDPVHAGLAGRYPMPGRTEFQRTQVVSAYLQVKRLLAILEEWSRGDRDATGKLLSSGLDFPFFLLFHFLCPREHRESAMVLQGGFERVWGNPEVLRF